MNKQSSVFSEMEEWCKEDVHADTTRVDKSVVDGRQSLRCSIEKGNKSVELEVDEDQNGRVEFYGAEDESHSWSGDLSKIDLHNDGATMVGDRATFSFNWD